MAAENDLANSKKAKKDKKSKKDKKDKKHKKADADSSGEPLPGEDAFDEEVRRLLEDDDDDAPAAVPVDALSSKQSPGAEVQKEQPPLEKIEHSSEDPLSKRPRTGDSPSDVNSSGTASKTEAVGAEETSFWDALHTKVSGGSVEGGSGLVPLQHEAGQPEAASSEFGVSAAHAALLARKMERIMSISGAKLSLRRNRLSIAGGPASVPALRYARAVVDRKVTAIDSVDDMSLVFVSLDWADNWTGQDVVEREEGVLIVPKVVQSSSSSSRSSFSPGDLVEFQSPETKIWSMATVMSRVASRRLRLRFSRDHVEQEVEDCLIRAAAVIAIFGDCRQRLAAEARILADFDSKSTGALAAWLQSPSRCARRLGSSGGSLPVRQETLWRLEKSPFPAQLLQATGCLAARFFLWPPVRPSSASGKVTQALPYVLFAGTQEQRWQALQILSTFAAGMDSRKHQSLPACLTGDCRTVSMPKGVLPVLMGKQMSGILQLMKSTRTFIFPLKEEDEKGADKDMDDMLEMMLDDKVLEGSCEVAIFGQPRARIGAELKIMALIEHERPGWITDKVSLRETLSRVLVHVDMRWLSVSFGVLQYSDWIERTNTAIPKLPPVCRVMLCDVLISEATGFAIDRIEALISGMSLSPLPALSVGEPSQGELLAAASGMQISLNIQDWLVKSPSGVQLDWSCGCDPAVTANGCHEVLQSCTFVLKATRQSEAGLPRRQTCGEGSCTQREYLAWVVAGRIAAALTRRRGKGNMMQQQINGCVPCTNCCVAVPQDRYYAVETFGKFGKVVEPGLACVGFDLCGCCISFRAITSRVEQNLVCVSTKTKDNVFVQVKVAVQQSVMPDYIELAMYKLSDVNQQVDSYVSDVVRSFVPHMTLDEAFEKKDDISDAVEKRLKTEMAAFGFCIRKALVTELMPNQDVVNSMNEINKQKRLRDAAIMAAEGEKIKVVKAAEASADAAQLQGEGISRQRRAIIDGLRDSITHGTGETMSTEKISELLLITQYFETLRDIAAQNKASAVFLPQGPGAVSDIASQIRNGILQGGAAAAPGQHRM
ncbi:unnamed protein product [Polarella glacialis]|uniref:Band 7 domain-containing protein n=1 Tax=Polarella glacialis TaxID=89957 RepID=A0A813DYQ1_POLGL|nr:unnamed protein product [Polarella glacialis]